MSTKPTPAVATVTVSTGNVVLVSWGEAAGHTQTWASYAVTCILFKVPTMTHVVIQALPK